MRFCVKITGLFECAGKTFELDWEEESAKRAAVAVRSVFNMDSKPCAIDVYTYDAKGLRSRRPAEMYLSSGRDHTRLRRHGEWQ